jgi:hypothetical protein
MACGDRGRPGDASGAVLPDGQWGGDGISLKVSGPEATFELGCATGTIAGPLVLDGEGRFERPGRFVQYCGVPGPCGGEYAARYTGRLRGSRLTLAIALDGGVGAPGPFELVRGDAGRVFYCP